ncbi:hypothetical protein BGX24_012681 [Mortierella sp. AD032]|nr:hypothetical protein BGX24_012681 [Mortierella sp. AD032]
MSSIPKSIEEFKFSQWWGHLNDVDYPYYGEGDWVPPLFGENAVSEDAIQRFWHEYRQRRQVAKRSPDAILATTSISAAINGSEVPAILPNLKKLIISRSCVDQLIILQLLPWFPAVKCLAFVESSIVWPIAFAQSLMDHCPMLSSIFITRMGHMDFGDLTSTACSLLLCTSLRGWKTVALTILNPIDHLGSETEMSLLHHSDTLETLFIEGVRVPSTFVEQVLCATSRLKCLVINSALGETDPALNGNFVQAEAVRAMRRLFRGLAGLTTLKEFIIGYFDLGSTGWRLFYPVCYITDSTDHPPPHFIGADHQVPQNDNLMDKSKPSWDIRQSCLAEMTKLDARWFRVLEEDQRFLNHYYPLMRDEYRHVVWKEFTRSNK